MDDDDMGMGMVMTMTMMTGVKREGEEILRLVVVVVAKWVI